MAVHERITAVVLFTVVVALLLVGLVSGTIWRHVVQVLPVFVAGLVAMRRPGWSRFAAMPVFVFWLFIMLLIWLYLLGLANVITGKFTPPEVVLTAVVGIACVVGLGASVRRSAPSRWWTGLAAFVVFGALQVGAMWLSLQPALATR
jgi:hypothetical protein